MNLIYYLLFIIYFFIPLNSVESRLSHVKVLVRNGAKVYVCDGKTFNNFGAALDYNRRKRRPQQVRRTTRRPIRRPTRRPTRLPTRRPNRLPTRLPGRRTTRRPILGRTTPRPGPVVTPPRQTNAPTTTQDPIITVKNHYYQEINKYRVLHQVQPLKIDPELEKKAQEHAKKMAEAEKQSPDTDTTYGENTVRSDSSLEGGVEYWYSRIKKFDFNKKERNNDNVEFINLVWKSTTHMGCGIAKDKKNFNYYVSCKFNPKADTFNSDEVKKNVLEAKKN